MNKMNVENMKRLSGQAWAAALVLAFAMASGLPAQNDSSKAQNPPETSPPASPGQPGAPARLRNGLTGTVSTVGVDRFEVKKADGSAQTVMIDDQTKYRQDQKDIHLEDLKSGDRVFVRLREDGGQDVKAAMVTRVTAEDAQRMQQMRGHHVFGQIVSIDGNQLKIQSPRQGEKIVVVSDQTTFTNEGQPSTLKGLKVGDHIAAEGDDANGKFAATRVVSGQFQRGQGQGRGRRNTPNQ